MNSKLEKALISGLTMFLDILKGPDDDATIVPSKINEEVQESKSLRVKESKSLRVQEAQESKSLRVKESKSLRVQEAQESKSQRVQESKSQRVQEVQTEASVQEAPAVFPSFGHFRKKGNGR